MNFIKFVLAFVLFYNAKSELTDEKHSFEVVIKGNNFNNCKGFIVGSFWALTIKQCIYGQDIQSLQLEDIRGNKYNVVKIVDTLFRDEFSHLDAVMLKVDNSMGEKGIVIISPDMAEEGSQLQTQTKIKTMVSNYNKCEHKYGNKGGIFCSYQKQPPILMSTGLYQNGMLIGITVLSNKYETVSISAPYLSDWIMDTMSEIKQ